jgi:hypothetical protein
MSETKFHIHMKLLEKFWFCIGYFNVYISKQQTRYVPCKYQGHLLVYVIL